MEIQDSLAIWCVRACSRACLCVRARASVMRTNVAKSKIHIRVFYLLLSQRDLIDHERHSVKAVPRIAALMPVRT